jgi:hypothetical protein
VAVVVVVATMVVRIATGRLPNPHAELVQRLEDVGVTAQQTGDQDGQQQHHDAQDNGQGNQVGPPYAQ